MIRFNFSKIIDTLQRKQPKRSTAQGQGSSSFFVKLNNKVSAGGREQLHSEGEQQLGQLSEGQIRHGEVCDGVQLLGPISGAPAPGWRKQEGLSSYQ